jgi:hypothetical protein
MFISLRLLYKKYLVPDFAKLHENGISYKIKNAVTFSNNKKYKEI